jgi:hypothetical protein
VHGRQLDVSHRPWDQPPMLAVGDPCHRSTWGGVLYRMRRGGDRDCGRLTLTKQSPIATRRRSLSGSRGPGAEASPGAVASFCSLSILTESAGEP